MPAGKIDKPIKNYLMDFGLTEKEVKLYLALLKTGPNTIMNLARETNIKRSTTHNNVEELIKKGLVSQTNYGERRMVVAEDPGKLTFLLEQKKWDMKKLEDNMPDIVGLIKESVPESGDKGNVDVKYYQGQKGFLEVCNRALNVATKEILFISNPYEFRKVFTEEYDKEQFIPKRLQKKLDVRTLVPNDEHGINVKNQDQGISRSTRYLPANFKMDPTIMIYDNEVSIMVSAEPYTSILMVNKHIYEAFLSIFESLWGLSSEA